MLSSRTGGALARALPLERQPTPPCRVAVRFSLSNPRGSLDCRCAGRKVYAGRSRSARRKASSASRAQCPSRVRSAASGNTRAPMESCQQMSTTLGASDASRWRLLRDCQRPVRVDGMGLDDSTRPPGPLLRNSVGDLHSHTNPGVDLGLGGFDRPEED